MATSALSKFCLSCIVPLLLAVDASATETGEVSQKAPPFTLPDPERNEHRLADYAGKVLVVNFWASWCVPCREELPSMNRAAKRMSTQAVAWLAINVGEDQGAVTAFRNDYPIDFTVLLDRAGKVSQDWGVIGLPTTFVVDARGYLAQRIAGKRDWDDEQHRQMLLDYLDD